MDKRIYRQTLMKTFWNALTCLVFGHLIGENDVDIYHFAQFSLNDMKNSLCSCSRCGGFAPSEKFPTLKYIYNEKRHREVLQGDVQKV